MDLCSYCTTRILFSLGLHCIPCDHCLGFISMEMFHVWLYDDSSHSMLFCHDIFQWSSGRRKQEPIGRGCLNRLRRYYV